MEQAAKMPESHADLLLSESLRAARYAKAPSLYSSERKLGHEAKLATDVSGSFSSNRKWYRIEAVCCGFAAR
jgi:hypothetical protein